MSIIAAAATPPDTLPAVLAGAALISVLAAAGTGMFKAGSVNRPSRLPPSRGAAFGLMGALSCGLFVWLATQLVYGSLLRAAHAHGGFAAAPAAFTEADLRPVDWAFLATVPFLAGFAAMVGCDELSIGGPATLGLGRRVADGIARGVVGILCAIPILLAVNIVAEQLYDKFHYVHPQEHELLKMMSDSHNAAVKIALIAGAVVCAPLFEETLFRGHVQTLLRELFAGFNRKNSRPGATQTWAAIVLSSAIFTAIHPQWMWPPLFVLALALGYAYERTGNLWTTITMHALFNGASTFFYLHGQH
jgi:membrane protease YdiL (CAAX protease family)